MSVYGNIVKAESESFNLKNIVEDIQESYTEICISLAEDVDYGYIEEGANIETGKILMNCRKQFKALSSDVKKAIKDKDKTTAKKKLEELKKVVNEARKEVRKMDPNVGSAILGLFSGFVVHAARNIGWIIGLSAAKFANKQLAKSAGKNFGAAASSMFDNFDINNFEFVQDACNWDVLQEDEDFASNAMRGVKKGAAVAILGTVRTIVSLIKAIFDIVKTLSKSIEELKSGEKVSNAFNHWRTQILICFDDLDKSIKCLENAVDKM